MSPRPRDLALGAASGFAASFLMDRATTAYLERQSEGSVRRQDELAPGGAPALFIRRTAGLAGAEVGIERSQGYALVLHRTMTSATGAVAAALVGPDRSPMRAGLLAATGTLLFVDEGLPALRIVPPPQEWPLESHARGVIGHLVLGLGIGAILSFVGRLTRLGR